VLLLLLLFLMLLLLLLTLGDFAHFHLQKGRGNAVWLALRIHKQCPQFLTKHTALLGQKSRKLELQSPAL